MAFRRGLRLGRRSANAKVRRRVNAISKQRERARRDARMMETVKSGGPPYTPDVMSWLSRRLDVPSSRITADHIAKLS